MNSSSHPTVVLLHSSASSARQWEALKQALQPRFRVHAIDFHDHGEQMAWRGGAPLTLADEAALFAPLLAEADGAHVVGHSYGGAVALKLATMHPQLVRSVVAYEPVMFRWLLDNDAPDQHALEVVALADSIRNRLWRNRAHAAAQAFVDFWSGTGAWQSLASGRQHSIAGRMRAVLQHFDALFREPLQRARLARLEMPMLFMTGAHTVAVTRRIAEVLRRTLPKAHHAVLQAMGHMGPMTHAAEVNRRIAQFLDAHAWAGWSRWRAMESVG